MRINLITVGKLKESFWKEAVREYEKRLKGFCQFKIVEVPEDRNLLREARGIQKHLKGYIIIFDIYGHMCNSQEFAEIFSKQLSNGISEFSLIIGSSFGLHEDIKRLAHINVSFGLVTYPHQLMRIIATEQIYRAMTIINKRTYHK